MTTRRTTVAPVRMMEQFESRRLLASIYGSVFNDVNFNGLRDAGESISQQAVVFLDTNNDGLVGRDEATAIPNPNGGVAFDGLAAGDYRVRVLPAAGLVNTTLAPNAAFELTLASSETKTLPAAGIATQQPAGSIRGFVYRDENNSGQPDAGDVYGALASLFIDANNNGVREVSEPTTSADSRGNFVFTGLADGRYIIRPVSFYKLTVPQNQYREVVVSGSTGVTAVSFGFSKVSQSISGVLFRDDDLDSSKDSNEPYITGGAVFIDLNRNGQREDTEPLAQNLDFTFSFAGLAPGTYELRALGGTDYIPTRPEAISVTVSAGSSASTRMGFLPVDNQAISGTLYADLDADGVKDSGEAAFPDYGVTVYVDANNNGQFDTAEKSSYTGGSGNFLFNGMTPGPHTLRVLAPSQYKVTDPLNGARVVNVPIGQSVSGVSIGVSRVFGISVSVVNDLNGNAVQDTSDVILANRVVYLDLNDNGQLDTGEPNAATGQSGTVATIDGVLPGTYRLRTVVPTGWRATGQSASLTALTTSPNFANDSKAILPTWLTVGGVRQFSFFQQQVPVTRVYGFVIRDTNGNGVSNSGETGTTPGDIVYVDANNNGIRDSGEAFSVTTSNGFQFYLQPGVYRIRQDLPSGWVQTSPAGNAAHVVTIVEGGTPPILYFYRYQPPTTTGSISGVTFDDSNKNGQLDTGETKTSGKTVFLDSNNNGTLDTGEKSTPTSTTGAYSFTNLPAGTYYVRRVFPSGYTYSNLPLNLTLASGQNITNANIGSVPVGTPPPPPPPPPGQTGSIAGFTFDDKNKNGLLDSGETKTSGKTVFLDTNNNGKLDTGEKSTKTNTSGAYAFTNLSAGTYYVRRVFPSGYTYSNTPLDLALAAGQSITNANIGSIAGTVTPPPPPPPPPTGDPKTASISGFLFWDSDRDGKFDTGESYQTGKTVFIDLDDDNVLDANETKLTTDSKGAFKFTGLSAGTYVIKRVVPTGYKITTPKQVVTLTAGQVFSGVAIGTNT